MSEAPITDKQIASASAKIEARKRFEAVFPLLVDELTAHLSSINLPENAIEWYKQVLSSTAMSYLTLQNLNYNTPGGKLNRGLSVVDTYQILVGQPLGDEIYLKASILGWAVELVFITYLTRVWTNFVASCKLIFLLRMI